MLDSEYLYKTLAKISRIYYQNEFARHTWTHIWYIFQQYSNTWMSKASCIVFNHGCNMLCSNSWTTLRYSFTSEDKIDQYTRSILRTYAKKIFSLEFSYNHVQPRSRKHTWYNAHETPRHNKHLPYAPNSKCWWTVDVLACGQVFGALSRAILRLTNYLLDLNASSSRVVQVRRIESHRLPHCDFIQGNCALFFLPSLPASPDAGGDTSWRYPS